ncbi:MAG TPA: cysteine desulfurase family protein [Planctomycetota bacterium]|nr:cysteine desulfurase family protein [Planctomycetota bacterium]
MGPSLRLLHFDHNATTPVDEAVAAEMLPYLTGKAGNPSSSHAWGREARVAVERARARIARVVGARPDQVVLTSGGTEANNLAILGSARATESRGRHLLTTAVEHASVLGPFSRLREEGFEVEIVPVDGTGRVDPDAVRGAIRPDTILLSVMAANNETGALQPLDEIVPLLPRGILLHCDASQVPGKVPLGLGARNANLLTLSSHKVYGPKGAGALVVREPARPAPLFYGGGQERDLRPGTENVPSIVGFAVALEWASARVEEYRSRVEVPARRLLDGLRARIPGCRLLGPGVHERRLPNTFTLSFPVADGRALVAALDLAGILVSSGSACASGAPEPSHVLLAMGIAPAEARRAIRFSLGRNVTAEDVEEAIARAVQAVEPLLSKAIS